MSHHKSKIALLRNVSLAILGLLIFYSSSQLDFNYFVRGYLSLLELQIGVVVIFFIASKLRKNRDIQNRSAK